MPTNRRRRSFRHRADVAALTAAQFHYLAHGWRFLGDLYGTPEEVQAAWQAHRETILGEWVPFFPGTRPYAMWAVELVPRHGPRRVLTGAEVLAWCQRNDWPTRPLADLERDQRQWARARNEDALFPELVHTYFWPPLQESEASYLHRHNLLGDQERRDLEEGRGHRLYDLDRADLWGERLAAIYGETSCG